MVFESYEELLKQYGKIINIFNVTMQQCEEASKEDKEKETEHRKIVKEHIEYVFQRTKERKINIADVWLTKLQDGIRLTVEEVEQYANDNKYIIYDRCYTDQSVSCVRIYVGKVL